MSGDIRIVIGARNLASPVLRRVSTDVGLLSKSLTRFSGVAAGAVESIGRSLQQLGTRSAAFGASALTGFGIATKEFVDFEQAMLNVKAVTEGAFEGEAFDLLIDKARELGKSTHFTAVEVAESMEQLGMAGLNASEVMASVAATLDVATAGNLDLGLTADIVTNIASSYGVAAAEMSKVGDIVAKVATTSNATIETTGETFKFVGAQAKLTGQSIEDTAAAIATLAKNGIKGTLAGTDLKNILSRLAIPKFREPLEKELGVEVINEATGEMRPFLQVLRDVNDAMQGMTGPEKLEKFVTVFGERSAKSAAVLAETTEEAMLKMQGAMKDSAGAAKQMAETKGSALLKLANRVKSAYKDIGIEIGAAFKDDLRQAGESLIKLFNKMSVWVKRNSDTIRSLRNIAIAITAAGIAVAALGTAISSIAIGPFALALGAVGAAVVVAVEAFSRLMKKIGGTDEALAVVSATINKAWGDFKRLGRVVSTTVDGIGNALAAGDWQLAMKITWTGIKLFLVDTVISILDNLSSLLVNFLLNFGQFNKTILSMTAEMLFSVDKLLRDPTQIGALLNNLHNFEIKDLGFGIVEGIKEVRDDLRHELAVLNEIAKEKAREAAKEIPSTWQKISGKLGDSLSAVAQKVTEIQDRLSPATKAYERLLELKAQNEKFGRREENIDIKFKEVGVDEILQNIAKRLGKPFELIMKNPILGEAAEQVKNKLLGKLHAGLKALAEFKGDEIPDVSAKQSRLLTRGRGNVDPAVRKAEEQRKEMIKVIKEWIDKMEPEKEPEPLVKMEFID